MGKHLKSKGHEKAGILTKLIRECEYARSTKLDHIILVGLEARQFLDRITGGKGSFMSFPYAQEEGAEPLMVRVKKVGKGFGHGH